MPKRKDISDPNSLARTSLEIERPLLAKVRSISTIQDVSDRDIYNRAIQLWVATYEKGGMAATEAPNPKFSLPGEREPYYTLAADEAAVIQCLLTILRSPPSPVRATVLAAIECAHAGITTTGVHGSDGDKGEGITDETLRAAERLANQVEQLSADAGHAGQHSAAVGGFGANLRKRKA